MGSGNRSDRDPRGATDEPRYQPLQTTNPKLILGPQIHNRYKSQEPRNSCVSMPPVRDGPQGQQRIGSVLESGQILCYHISDARANDWNGCFELERLAHSRTVSSFHE